MVCLVLAHPVKTTKMNIQSNENKPHDELPRIKPKMFTPMNDEDDFVMSRIHVSKNWKLPPMTTYTSGRKRKTTTERSRSPSETEELLLKKQRQNRDAQRAYRERKEKKMKEMEHEIESLQNKVKYWQKLYQSKCNEMIHFENKYNQLVMSRQDVNPSKDTTTSTDLYDLIDRFKPIQSVPLTAPKPIFNGSFKPMPLLSKSANNNINKNSGARRQKCNHKHTHTHVHSRTQQNVTLPSSTPSSCGFCDGGPSCICNELTNTTEQQQQSTNSPLESLSYPSTTSSFDTLPASPSPPVPPPEVVPIRNKPPMTIAQLTCSSDPHTCTKCSDINQTCIKPVENNRPVNNNPNEIDFTTYN